MYKYSTPCTSFKQAVYNYIAREEERTGSSAEAVNKFRKLGVKAYHFPKEVK